jgi:microcompartment protein CcmL/EutN
MAEKNTIGIIELASIFKGFEVQDMVLKSANVEKMVARTICSGKFLIMVRGEIADVESCLEVASEIGGFSVVNVLMVPNVHEKVFPAIAGNTTLDSPEVGGMLVFETFSVASAVKAADFAVKEADIDLLRIHVAMAIGGKGFVVFTGNVEALESAIPAVLDYIKEEGMLAGYSLIKNPHKELLTELI